jgi:hypothetical protein
VVAKLDVAENKLVAVDDKVSAQPSITITLLLVRQACTPSDDRSSLRG